MPICTNVSLKVYLCIWKCICLLECVPVYPKVYMCIWKYGGVPKSANVDRYMYHQQSIVAVMRQSLGPVNGQLWSKNGYAWHVPPLSTNMSHRPHWTTHQLAQAAAGVSVEKCRDIRLFNICELIGLLEWVLDIYNGCFGLFRGLRGPLIQDSGVFFKGLWGSWCNQFFSMPCNSMGYLVMRKQPLGRTV